VSKPLTYDEARADVDKFKKTLAEAEQTIKKYWVERYWDVLGYPNWDAFVKAEFNGCMLRVPRENLIEVVRSMSVTMSDRPIASALGISRETVGRARRAGAASDTNVSPAKPKAAPKPDRFLQQFGEAHKQFIEGALEMQRLCKDRRFLIHRAALVKQRRESVLWGARLMQDLVPNFDDPNIVLLDDEDGAA
jgi:hypothetical protein